MYHPPPPPTIDNPVLRFVNGDMCIFGTLTVQTKHKCARGCVRYLHGFIRDILVEDGFFVDEHSYQLDRSTFNQAGINISVDTTVTDPFVHTCMTFNSVQDIKRQKMCHLHGRGKE